MSFECPKSIKSIKKIIFGTSVGRRLVFKGSKSKKKTVYFKISDHSALWRRFVVLQTYVVKHGCARSVGGSFLKGGETTTAVS